MAQMHKTSEYSISDFHLHTVLEFPRGKSSCTGSNKFDNQRAGGWFHGVIWPNPVGTYCSHIPLAKHGNQCTTVKYGSIFAA